MTIEEIRKGAQPDATHYYEWWSDLFDEDMYTYLKIVNGVIHEMERGIWKETTFYNNCETKPL